MSLLNLAGGSRAAEVDVVTYEQFGAVGDGLTDDLPAIVAAHAEANATGLPVRSDPEATYHLGRQALTAVIETDTDWSTSRFIIDDSQGVEDHKRPLFEVRSSLAPVPLAIERLRAGQERLETPVPPEFDLLVFVENAEQRRYLRKGLNVNAGTPQNEVFILRRDGSIEGAIEWDYDVITQVEARPMDPETLTLKGGYFVHVANRMKQPEGYNYWARGIRIQRSNTVVEGVSYEVVGETDFGHPYMGFLEAQKVANITLRDCRIEPHKFYWTIGSAGKPVPMGTYGYRADRVVNYALSGCRMGDIHDRSRWGVAATNFMKNVLVEDCVLSRMDVHMGVSGYYIIRNSTLGHMGINAIGRGRLVVEGSTVHSERLLNFRPDYGATWDGDVVVRNSRWVPPASEQGGGAVAVFGVRNDGTHDFGYQSSMPSEIVIDGLTIEDAALREQGTAVYLFDDPSGALDPSLPHPYRPTERVEIHKLDTTSGQPVEVSADPRVETAVGIENGESAVAQ
ncbi:hypothetical protein [Actomonas aquatica]|uniref:Pectate lyase superfamily protein domain-containing protein n=1 Tax=Actomonas aquatica TaxID=2866162 RepID=A0ABZ1C6M8_9BACT|nr:hypothetical protein [Opitutus sp. WL0086]WRQ87244.1 hypothetical protein K1X11_020720 [Opitutus sp. WL0086]